SPLLQGPDQQLDLRRAFRPPRGKQAGIAAQRRGQPPLLSTRRGSPPDRSRDVVPAQGRLGAGNDASDDRAGLGRKPPMPGPGSALWPALFFFVLAAGPAAGTMRSSIRQPRMSSSAIKTLRLSRSGLSVTS